MTGTPSSRDSEPAPPTALVSWAHQDPDWTQREIEDRRQNVVRLVTALRTHGIDADADFYYDSDDVDWTRWGPARIRDVDVVLIVVSRAWKDAWEGRGDMSRNIGAATEADVLRSISTSRRDAMQVKCRLVMLPGSSSSDIPDGLHGVNRHSVNTFDAEGLETLLRDLTKQPLHLKPPLGQVPVLPPALTDPTSTHGTSGRSGAAATPMSGTRGSDVSDQQRAQLRAQLEALPTPRPGEGPHLPWYREWERVRQELAALGDRSDCPDGLGPPVGGPTGDVAGSARTAGASQSDQSSGSPLASGEALQAKLLPWQPVEDDVVIPWTSDGRTCRYSADYTAVYVHLVPVPAQRITERVFARVCDELPALLRDRACIPAAAGLDVEDQGDVVAVRVTPERSNSAFNAVAPGGLRGLRLDAAGAATAWAELPRDNMGSVLDPDRLTTDLTECIRLAAAALRAVDLDPECQVTIAAEVTPVTLLTDGTTTQLGQRSSATVPGAIRSQPVAMKPEESLQLNTYAGDRAAEVAAVVSQLLQRSWAQR